MPSIIPYLTVKNIASSVHFYQKVFGFQISQIGHDDDVPIYAEMRNKDIVIMFCPELSSGTNQKSPATLGISMPISLYMYCENVDDLYKKSIHYGAKSKSPPYNSSWGDRVCTIVDIDGYEWSFATHIYQEHGVTIH
ncbi:MAG: VOC family protein [Rickettsiaceae bacterium]